MLQYIEKYRPILFPLSSAPIRRGDKINPKTENVRLHVKQLFISDNVNGNRVKVWLRFGQEDCIFTEFEKCFGSNCLHFCLNCYLNISALSEVSWTQ